MDWPRRDAGVRPVRTVESAVSGGRIRLADIPTWSDHAEQLLGSEFIVHPWLWPSRASVTTFPRLQVYLDHLFVVVHAPEIGEAGHVHISSWTSSSGRAFWSLSTVG